VLGMRVPLPYLDTLISDKLQAIQISTHFSQCLLGITVFLAGIVIQRGMNGVADVGAAADLISITILLTTAALALLVHIRAKLSQSMCIREVMRRFHLYKASDRVRDMKSIVDDELGPSLRTEASLSRHLLRGLYYYGCCALSFAVILLFRNVICELPMFSNVDHCAYKLVSPLVVFTCCLIAYGQRRTLSRNASWLSSLASFNPTIMPLELSSSCDLAQCTSNTDSK